MDRKSFANKLLFLLLLTLFLGASACAPAEERFESVLPQSNTPAVDPLFREFYRHLGGVETLGPAISYLGTHENFRLQFTVASLLVYNTEATNKQDRFSLAPLGLELDVAEPAVPPPDNPDLTYINGHVIYPKFVPIYEKLGGARFVGKPITEMRYNPDKKRIEQYFENLGFYAQEGDTEGKVFLLAYGAFKCDRFCRYPVASESSISRQGVIPEPFASAVTRLGTALTGRKISEPTTGADGNQELTFDNLVLYSDQDRVYARPIVQMLGIEPDSLVPRIDDVRLDFYQLDVNTGLGHNVPVIFSEYLAIHGSLDIAGQPITEIFLHDAEEEIYRQCFTNLCLDYYHQIKDESMNIRPAPMGIVYKNQFQVVAERAFSDAQSLQTLTLKVWESKPLITSAEVQEIFVATFEDQVPLENMEPDLILTNPIQGKSFTKKFPPTDEKGFTFLEVFPIAARNGTIIPYKVCLQSITNERACIEESYLIWGNP